MFVIVAVAPVSIVLSSSVKLGIGVGVNSVIKFVFVMLSALPFAPAAMLPASVPFVFFAVKLTLNCPPASLV